MTTEDDFQQALDKQPDDWQTRLVFADFLEERGDPRAAGYRIMGLWRLIARHNIESGPYGCHEPEATESWEWWSDQEAEDPQLTTCRVPLDWLRKIRSKFIYPDTDGGGLISKDFHTRREADDAAARAFGKLPAKRREELFAEPVKERVKKLVKKPAKKPAKKRASRKRK